MMSKKKPDNFWGRRLAFVEALGFLVCLSLAIGFRANAVGTILAIGFFILLAGSSAVVAWRAVRRKPGDPPVGMNQIALLPKKWRQWVLGDSDRDV